ncbi:MAG: TetR/AcrR family transcriptional regulator [Opitutales bacterium]|nr:TetR/AcrR family transcriptional regulator [Opitutales bacterium]
MQDQTFDKSEKKELIAEAALRVFSERGYEKTSISEVAKVAGIGKGTVYEYFSSKDELLCEAVYYYLSTLEPLIDDISRDIHEMPPLDQLREMLLRLACAISETPSLSKLYPVFMEMMVRQPEWVKKIRFAELVTKDTRELIRSFIFAAVEGGVLPESCRTYADRHAINIMAAFDGLMFDYLMSDSYFGLREQFLLMVDTYIGGMQKC